MKVNINNSKTHFEITEQIIADNIKCDGCINSIKTTLLKIADLQEVSVEKETGTVRINGSLPLNGDEIVQQLAKMVYPEAGNNHEMQKIKSYPGCASGKMSTNKLFNSKNK